VTRARAEPLPRAFWCLLLATLVNRIGGFVVPFLALHLTNERHLAIGEVGVVLALYGLGSIAAGPAGGILADRVGRRFTIGASTFSGAIAMLGLAQARTSTELIASAFVLGSFGEMYRPASSALVADLVPSPGRPRAYGLLYWAANVGFSIAVVLAGLLAGRSFELLFVADAATTIAFGAFVVATTKTPSVRGRASSPRLSLSAPYRSRAFLVFCGLSMLVSVIYFQVQVTLPVDMRAHGISPRTYGMLLALNGVLVVLLQPLVSSLVSRLPRAIVLSVGSALVGLGFGMTGIARGSTTFYTIAICMWTLGEIATAPITPSVIADLSPADLRGSYQGAFHVATGSASFIGPMFGSFVYAAYGAVALWTACALAGVGVALAFTMFDRGGERMAISKASTGT
jgi:MFS family permease